MRREISSISILNKLMENLVAYNLSCPDNDSYMFSDTDIIEKCASCNYKIDFLKYNPDYFAKKLVLDVSATYDGFCVFSQKFRDFCLRKNFENVEFQRFSKLKSYYNIVVNNVVTFDSERRKTRFLEKCLTCGNYESIVGAHPVYLKLSEPILTGIYRSDLFFASGNSKHPLIFAGIETMAEMKKEKLTGLEFSKAFGLETI
jgi:hypothetical protein